MVQHLNLAVRHWQAWRPGIATTAQWQALLAGEVPVSDDASPAVTFVEPLLRRRLSRLSRLLLAVAKPCVDAAVGRYQLVFANRHGELTTTVQLLQSLAQGETPSPMGFSLSVHNTAAGLYSIACADRAPATALAAGSQTLFAALVEAQALLASGVESVVVAYAEEPLPPIYRNFDHAQVHPTAVGLTLVSAADSRLPVAPTMDALALIRHLCAVSA